MNDYRFPQQIRELLLAAIPEDRSIFGRTPELQHTYVPTGHARALHPDSMLVVGTRGAGKSFWWSALQSDEHRRFVADLMPKSGISPGTRVSLGFGERPSPHDYPGKDVLAHLLKTFDARQVWRTVVIHKLVDPMIFENLKSWADRVKWVVNNPEEVDGLLYDADRELDRQQSFQLILFDALDRTADDWKTMFKLVRGLLQVLLEFRAYARIRPKAFVRPDHIEDAAVADFPDSSKVLTQRVDLRWPRNELYGLLWQYLANEVERGALFREGCREGFGISWKETQGVWTAPENLRNDEELQRRVFHAITGPWMGGDRRRGFPYTWLPNHLGDAYRQVSPRSFLAALRHAAQDQPREGYPYALFYESIKRGVQEASRIRVREMQEDYPWVKALMTPLEGLTVPCTFGEIESRWKTSGALDQIRKAVAGAGVKLPPVRLDSGGGGVRQDVETLGVFERMNDDRVNVPDVYRVGYGLRRRGGVKAVSRD